MVHEGAVVAEARNQTEAQGDPTAHAEMLCIQQAAAQLGRWRLLETTLYVTLEPCPMCAGALLQARVGHLVYAARSPLLGADGSWVNMLQHGRAGSTQSAVADPTRPHPFHTDIKSSFVMLETLSQALCLAGAYTTARTVGRTSVFELSFHINRLAESCQLMLQAEADAVPSLLQKTEAVDSSRLLKQHQSITEAARLRPDVVASLHTAVDAFLEAHPQHQGELKLTVLITWRDRQELRGAPRSNAAAKDSKWVQQRQALEKDKPTDVNEIILAQDDGAVLEGMSSSFFAVQDGTLYTAGEGVLLGTIRDLAIKVRQQEGLL
eukprot:jgi/Astpho2/4588/Aster-x1219